ncbi:MAG: hypothetical protein LBE20_01095 [Deltaproteobacteria bacterium]|nr:hypothetical protein [Deltaproteobacteria bacterium]
MFFFCFSSQAFTECSGTKSCFEGAFTVGCDEQCLDCVLIVHMAISRQ